MQSNVTAEVEIKKAYVEPKLAELGDVAEFTLTPEPGASHICSFTSLKNIA